MIYMTLNALKMGEHTNDVKFLGDDKTLPYVLRDGQYRYFAAGTKAHKTLDDGRTLVYVQKDFVLVMTSSKDLQA